MHKAKDSMTKVDTVNGYDLYIGSHLMKGMHTATIYNIVPVGSAAPVCGYKNMRYIEGGLIMRKELFDLYEALLQTESKYYQRPTFDANGDELSDWVID